MRRIFLLANLCLAFGLTAPRILFAESGLIFDQVKGTLTGQLNVTSNIVAAGSVTANTYFGGGDGNVTGIIYIGNVANVQNPVGHIFQTNAIIPGGRIAEFRSGSNPGTAYAYVSGLGKIGAVEFGPLTAASAILRGNMADGAAAVGVVLDNSVSLAASDAKLLSIRNNGAEKAAFTKDGDLSLYDFAGAETRVIQPFYSGAAWPSGTNLRLQAGTSGNSGLAGGNIYLTGGSAYNGNGGDVILQPGVATGSGAPGYIRLFNNNFGMFQSGSLIYLGILPGHGNGDVNIAAGAMTSASGGAVNLLGGAGSGAGAGGDVVLTGGVSGGSSVITGSVKLKSGTAERLVISGAADGASVVGTFINSPAYTTAGAKLLSVRNNGTEKMYVDKDGGGYFAGTVGIGMTNPTAALHLRAGTAAAGTAPLKLAPGVNLATTEAGAIEYDGSHLYFSPLNAGSRYQLDQQAPLTVAAIGAVPNVNGMTLTGQQLSLQPADATYGGVVTTGAQTFAGGKTFSSQLTNSSANTAALNLTGAGAGVTFTGTGPNQIMTASGVNLALMPGGAGNVGVGTTSPGAKLEIAATDYNNALKFSGNGTFTLGRNISDGAVTLDGGAGSTLFRFSNQGAQYARMDSDGMMVGLGAPIGGISTQKTVSYNGLGSVFSANAGNGGYINIRNTNNGNKIAIGNDGNGNTLFYNQAGNTNFVAADEKMRITGAGNVGIGTASPLAKLHAYVVPAAYNTVDDVLRLTSKFESVGNAASAAVGSGPAIVFSGGIGDNQTRDRARIVAVYEDYNVSGLAFHTQDTADIITEKVRIQNNGNVGIGTANPGAKLDILGNTGGGATNLTPLILHNNGDGNKYTELKFVDGTDNAATSIRAYRENSGGDYTTQLRFATNPTGATQTPVERVVITSAGNVGIGTTNPNLATLQVAGSIMTTTGLNVTGYGGFFNAANKFGVDQNGGISRFYASGADGTTAGAYEFHVIASDGTPDTIAMGINNLGKVGIGTTSPYTTLSVGSSDATAFITPGGNNTHLSLQTVGAGGAIRFYTIGGTTNNVAPTESMRITPDGSVGIGTTGPNGLLEVRKDQHAYTQVRVTNADMTLSDYGTQAGYWVNGTAANASIGALKWVPHLLNDTGAFYLTTENNYPLAFGINASPTPSMVINTSGNVGIGTTDPAGSKLNVQGGTQYFKSGSSDYSSIIFRDGAIEKSDGDRDDVPLDINYAGYNQGFTRYRDVSVWNGKGGIVLKADGSSGNVGIGTASPGSKLSIEGGLHVGGTSDAGDDNLLVDGTITQNGLKTTVFTGHTTGNSSFYVDVPVADEGGEGAIFKVEATFAHYSSMAYNTLREFYVSARGTAVELTNVVESNSANGGSWTASKPDPTTLRITKLAGNYVGGGKYYIRVTTP